MSLPDPLTLRRLAWLAFLLLSTGIGLRIRAHLDSELRRLEARERREAKTPAGWSAAHRAALHAEE